DKEFKDSDVELVAGLPSFPNPPLADLSAGMGTLNSYLMKKSAPPKRPWEPQVDPYVLANTRGNGMNQAQQYSGFQYYQSVTAYLARGTLGAHGGGGFGGAGGFV